MCWCFKKQLYQGISKIENHVFSSQPLGFVLFIAEIPFCPVSSTLTGTIRSKMLFFGWQMLLLMTIGWLRWSRSLRSLQFLGFGWIWPAGSWRHQKSETSLCASWWLLKLERMGIGRQWRKGDCLFCWIWSKLRVCLVELSFGLVLIRVCFICCRNERWVYGCPCSVNIDRLK